MKYQIVIRSIENKQVQKRDYREVGKETDAATGKPKSKYEYVTYELEEELRPTVLDVTVGDLSIPEVLKFLAERTTM